jgi:hypothetical protein
VSRARGCCATPPRPRRRAPASRTRRQVRTPSSCKRARACMLHACLDAVGMRGRVRVRACMLVLSLRVRSGDDVCADRCAPHSRRRTVVPPCQPIPLERRACATRARAVSRLVGLGASNDRQCLAAACRYASTDTRRLCRAEGSLLVLAQLPRARRPNSPPERRLQRRRPPAWRVRVQAGVAGWSSRDGRLGCRDAADPTRHSALNSR